MYVREARLLQLHHFKSPSYPPGGLTWYLRTYVMYLAIHNIYACFSVMGISKLWKPPVLTYLPAIGLWWSLWSITEQLHFKLNKYAMFSSLYISNWQLVLMPNLRFRLICRCFFFALPSQQCFMLSGVESCSTH